MTASLYDYFVVSKVTLALFEDSGYVHCWSCDMWHHVTSQVVPSGLPICPIPGLGEGQRVWLCLQQLSKLASECTITVCGLGTSVVWDWCPSPQGFVSILHRFRLAWQPSQMCELLEGCWRLWYQELHQSITIQGVHSIHTYPIIALTHSQHTTHTQFCHCSQQQVLPPNLGGTDLFTDYCPMYQVRCLQEGILEYPKCILEYAIDTKHVLHHAIVLILKYWVWFMGAWLASNYTFVHFLRLWCKGDVMMTCVLWLEEHFLNVWKVVLVTSTANLT